MDDNIKFKIISELFSSKYLEDKSDILICEDFKLKDFWNLPNDKTKIFFLNEQIKNNNLIDLILKSNVLYPKSQDIFNNCQDILFTQQYYLHDFKLFLSLLSKKNSKILFLNYNSNKIFNHFKNNFKDLILIGYTSQDIKIPNFIKISDLLNKLVKENEIYYLGKSLEGLDDKIEYFYTNKFLITQKFICFDEKLIDLINIKSTINFYNKKKTNKKITFVNQHSIKKTLIQFENNINNKKNLFNFTTNSSQDFPNISNIFKINFIINNKEFFDCDNLSLEELDIYYFMLGLTSDYLVYYNSILINDKIENKKIDNKKFQIELQKISKINFIDKKIIKPNEKQFDLNFYLNFDKLENEIYDFIPYPKIYYGNFNNKYCEDERHIIFIKSEIYLNILSSGLLKDENGKLLKIPKRYFIKNQLINNLSYNLSLNIKKKYMADYIILIETYDNTFDNLELFILENIIDELRIKYNKEIILLLTNNYKSKKEFVKNVENSKILKEIGYIDLYIVLNDIWKDTFDLPILFLNCIYQNIPILCQNNSITKEILKDYSGYYNGLNGNISEINNFKNFIIKKLISLLEDNLNENEELEEISNNFNEKSLIKTKNSFDEIILFLKNKNKLKNRIFQDNYNIDGINFYYNENINSFNLNNIYSNVQDFLNSISSFKNILLISSDYPDYGGAATLNSQIANFLRLKGHNCKELYYLFKSLKNKDDIIKKYNDNKYFVIDDEFYNFVKVILFEELLFTLDNLKFKPDLIILKNHLNGVVLPDKFKNIYYLVAGIYSNNLNKYYYDLSLEESNKFINKSVINCLEDKRIIGICNSNHTKQILERNYNIKTKLYYTNFIPYFPKKIPHFNNIKKREYKYGIICSDFNRPIKNIKNLLLNIKSNLSEDDKVILIGNNCKTKNILEIFKDNKNITYIDLIPHFLIPDYLKKIQFILIDSYYESCSNLAIESIFNGCNIIRKIKKNIQYKTKILITSTQYPGYGGSATNAYKMIKYLRKNNFNVAGLFFNKMKIEKVDCDNIGGIWTIRDNIKNINVNINDKNFIKNKINDYLEGYPDVIYAFNYYTPILSRLIYPSSYIYYFVVGNPVLTLSNKSIINQEISIQKFLNDKMELLEFDEMTYNLEKLSIEKADEIVIDQGELNIKTISKVHPEHKYLFHQYYNYGINILLDDLTNNTNNKTDLLKKYKQYDLIVISSNWDRKVKNPNLVFKLFNQFSHLNKIIIGKNSEIFNIIPNTTTINLVSYNEVQDYLSKSKILLITSFSETGPNTMIEAFFNNCNVITSKNIGYQRYLKDYNLCNDVYNIEEWESKIKYLLSNFNFIPIPKIEVLDDKEKMDKLLNFKNNNFKLSVLIVCGDKPYYGGAATNSYNLIKLLLKEEHNVNGLFISYQEEGLDDPDDLGCVEHIFLDDDIETKLKEWKKNKENNNINYDIIFCKNYKVFTLIKKLLPDIPIIYSPSGLRQITAEISKRKDYYQNLKNQKLELINPEFEYIPDDNWFQFIMKNDKYLENFALKNADYLLPNSQITYDIISKYYDENVLKNLIPPIYLSNIQHIEKTNFNFSNRKYDFGFIATNWKRATKNIWLVKSLIKKFKNSHYKIIVIGNNNNLHDLADDNIIIKDHLLRDEMIKEFQNIKTVVITSFYESNPNVLVEAIYSGCNVVSSSNAGNYENLRKSLIVKNPSKIDEWVYVLGNSIKKLCPYLGPTLNSTSKEFISLLKNYSFKMDAVGIYKINPKWELNLDIKKLNRINYKWVNSNDLINIEEHKGRNTDIFSNIYLHLFLQLTKKLKLKYNHFIFIDESLDNPIRTKWNNINIWILQNSQQVFFFNQAKFYFLRGNYPKFYNTLLPINAYSIFYPATSFKYSFNLSKKSKIIKRDLICNYTIKKNRYIERFNMVLSHEDQNYKKQYYNSKIVLFEKFGLNNTFKFLDIEKIYDIIICAQALQTSKNHQLIFDFIKFCDDNNKQIKIAYVSDKEVLEKNYDNFYIPKEDSSTKVSFFNNLSPKELCLLYNQSKTNLLLSHRDCVPRVIIESLLCGCYNISTDLLSDGKFYYDKTLGELIEMNYGEIEMIQSGMISYYKNPLFFKKILQIAEKDYNYLNISNIAKNKYNIENMVSKIIENI